MRGLNATRGVRFLGLLAALGLAAVPVLRAAQRAIATGSGVTTAWAGQRNVVFVKDWGYWVFSKEVNSDRLVWRFSADGQNFTAPQDVFPFLSLAPDAAAGYGSVWHRGDTNEIYVAAPDANVDINGTGATTSDLTNDASGNKVFIRRGQLTSSGGITWGTEGIRRQRMTIAESPRTNCQIADVTNAGPKAGVIDPIALKSVSIAFSSAAGVSYVSVFSDARHSLSDQSPAVIGVTNIRADLSDYLTAGTPNIYTYCTNAPAPADPPVTSDYGDTTLDTVGLPVVVPIRSLNAGRDEAKLLLAFRLPNHPSNSQTTDPTGGALSVRLSSSTEGRVPDLVSGPLVRGNREWAPEIGRASCRERV